ncbi:MAG: hypothetical protein IJS62_03515 [Bacteroidales bacterium]|nr:hypothetical protein [Bacteroidales bacterium]
MQILLNIPEGFYDDEISGSSTNEREIINQAYGLNDADEVEYVNIGPGADWIVLLTTFAGVSWTLVQVPGIIKRSIDGWKWLIEKLKGYIEKDLLVSLDQDAAGLLAIDYLASKFGADESFDMLDMHTIRLIDISGMVHNNKGEFVDHPHNYYVFTFRIADRIIILSVRSTGKIKELEIFHEIPYGLIDCKL